MGKSRKKDPAKHQDTNGGSPILPRTTETCDACSGRPNGLVYCFDGALQVEPFPTTGDGAYPKWVPGTGWVWINAALLEPGQGLRGAPPIPPAKDEPPASNPWPGGEGL